MKTLASVQETSLDIVWIRRGVVCLGSRPADRCYRAVLAVEGPPKRSPRKSSGAALARRVRRAS